MMRTLIGPPRPAISMSRASSRNTGAGKIPLPSRRARRVTSGASVYTRGWVAMRASSCALNALASSMSCCSMSRVAGRTVDIAPQCITGESRRDNGGHYVLRCDTRSRLPPPQRHGSNLTAKSEGPPVGGPSSRRNERSTGVGDHPTEVVVALDGRTTPAEGKVRQQQQGSVLAVPAKLVGAVRDAAAELPVARVAHRRRAEERVESGGGVVVSRRYERAAGAGAPVAGIGLDARQIGFECDAVVGLAVVATESWAGEKH